MKQFVQTYNIYLLTRLAALLIAAQVAACGSGGGSDSVAGPAIGPVASAAAGPAASPVADPAATGAAPVTTAPVTTTPVTTAPVTTTPVTTTPVTTTPVTTTPVTTTPVTTTPVTTPPTSTPPTSTPATGAIPVTSPATSTGAAGPICTGVGQVQPMSADPDSGAVDVSAHCLGVINGYRSQKGLAPYYLQSTSAQAVCCQAGEAKTAAETGGHADGGCGWKAQGFCGGGRNPNGTAKASVDWCPKLFYQEGPAVPPSSNHYTAMMETAPRGIMCSFYGVSRDKHSVVVNYY